MIIVFDVTNKPRLLSFVCLSILWLIYKMLFIYWKYFEKRTCKVWDNNLPNGYEIKKISMLEVFAIYIKYYINPYDIYNYKYKEEEKIQFLLMDYIFIKQLLIN